MKAKIFSLFSLLAICICSVLYLNISKEIIYANTESSLIISEDCEYKNQTFTIIDNTTDAIVINNGATVTLTNISFVNNSTKALNSIIKVEAGAKLILNDTNFTGLIAAYGVMNLGELELNNVTFSNSIQTSIYVDTDAMVENPCIIHSGVIKTIHLKQGYITVDEYTEFNDDNLEKINVTMEEESVGRLVVNGKNTFASYYLDRFNYAGSYVETVSGIEFDGYLDYVGDGLTKTIGSYTFNQGDIILTTKKIKELTQQIYIAGMYCTANNYLNESMQTILIRNASNVDGMYVNNITPFVDTNNAIMSTLEGIVNCTINIFDLSEDKRIARWSVDVPMLTKSAIFVDIPENYEYVSSNSTNNSLGFVKDFENRKFLRFMIDCADISSAANIDININFQEKETNPVVNVTKDENVQVIIPSDAKIGDTVKISFTIPDDLILDNVAFNNASVEYTNVGLTYEFMVELLAENNLIIVTKDKPIITYVDVIISTTDFTYNGSDQYSSLKPYYILNDSTVYVDFELYCNDQPTMQFKNVEDYEIRFLNPPQNIEFNQDGVSIAILPKELTVEFSQSSFVYDGIEKVVSATLKGVEGDESVKLTIENNKRTIAGSQDVIVSINDNNYVLASNSRTVTLFVDKATPNISGIKFDNQEFDYDGNVFKMYASDIPEYIGVSYLNNENSKAGTYNVYANLTLLDETNYKPLTTNRLHALMIINRADIETEDMLFDDFQTTYTGDNVSVQVAGIIPSQVTKITYTYYLVDSESLEVISKMDSFPVNAGTYRAVASFNIIDNNYNNIDDMLAIIVINKANIKLDDIVFESKEVTYTGEKFSIEPTNVPSMLDCSLDKKELINAGTYNIVATFTCDNKNYEDIVEYKLSATLKINKASYNMSGVSLQDLTTIYNKEYKQLLISGTLPEGLSVEYTNNNQINVGIYSVTASFFGSDNYNEIPSMSAKLTIKEKELNVSLVHNSFVYDGEVKTVEVSTTGVINGDSVMIKLINNSNTNAGNYEAKIDSISNPNYSVNKNVDLKYVISKANIDMSGISFDGKEVEYDGNNHSPVLTGDIPQIVTANISNPEAINVGTYTCVVNFFVSENYNRPQSMSCEIKILPKPIFVRFDGYTNLVEDGSMKSIDIYLDGVLEDNFDEYSVIYSQEPILGGTYNCSVVLDLNSNYKILGSNNIDFVILTPTKTYTSDNLSVQITGNGFLPESKLNISTTTEDTHVNALLDSAKISVDNYNKIKLSVDGESDEVFTVALKMGDFDTNDVNYLRVYKIVNNQLELVDFVIEDGKILFDAADEDEIILVQEKSSIVKNIIFIIIISILFALSISSVVAFMIINKKSKISG